MAARRYNCACGKKRYRDEESARTAAAADQQTYGEAVHVYRCPGGLAWHLTAHGFTAEALPSVGRRLAFALLQYETVDLAAFEPGADQRRRDRVRRCAEQMTALGLTTGAEPSGHLRAVDRAGLARVVQIGLDAYAEDHPVG